MDSVMLENIRPWLKGFLFIFALVSLCEANADELQRLDGSLTKEEVIRALSPEQTVDEAPTRGLKIQTKTATSGVKSAITQPPKKSNAISLDVSFDYNSADLTPEAIRQLTPVAEALISGELNRLQFRVEGYTDAKGSDDYNLRLSKLRAQSVRDFFVSQYGLDATRIDSIGYGESKLLDPANPDASMNRRVKIVGYL